MVTTVPKIQIYHPPAAHGTPLIKDNVFAKINRKSYYVLALRAKPYSS